MQEEVGFAVLVPSRRFCSAGAQAGCTGLESSRPPAHPRLADQWKRVIYHIKNSNFPWEHSEVINGTTRH